MNLKIISRRRIHTSEDELSELIRSFFRAEAEDLINELEREFAHFIGVRHAIAVSSGRKGMELILKSLNLALGDEVILPAYTLKDLIDIIHSLGLRVVPADIDLGSFNITASAIAERVNSRTKVVLATHLFGAPCKIDEIMELTRKEGLYLIEDCAHSIGSEFKGKKTGCFGKAGFFSFDNIKLLNTYGGGMVVTDSDEIAEKVRREVEIRQDKNGLPLGKFLQALIERTMFSSALAWPILYFLASPSWGELFYSFYRRMQKLSAPKNCFSPYQAKLGLNKIFTLEERIAKRNKLANLLRSRVDEEISFQEIEEFALSNYYFLVGTYSGDVIRLRMNLLRSGIDAGIRSEIADDCAGYLEYADCPNAKRVYQQALQLPLYEDLSESDIERIVETVNRLIA